MVTFKHQENQDIFESTVNEYQSTKVLIKSLAMNFEDTAILHYSYTTHRLEVITLSNLPQLIQTKNILMSFIALHVNLMSFIALHVNLMSLSRSCQMCQFHIQILNFLSMIK